MQVLCVYSVGEYVSVRKPIAHPELIPFGISLIAAALQRAGHEVRLLVLTPATPVRTLLEETFRDFRPRMACLTSVSTQIPIIARVGEELKRLDPSLFVVLGGHHAILNAEEAIGFRWVDAICVGEGEVAVVDLARQVAAGRSAGTIGNLWIKDVAGRSSRGPVLPFIENLDALPFIDRRLWEPWIYRRRERASLLLGRGCPNRCTYCSNHALIRRGTGRYVRFRSPANIVAELKHLLDVWPDTREAYLEVESLTTDLQYTRSLLEVLTEFNSTLPEPLIFGANVHPARHVLAQEDLLRRFRQANFRWINIGLESGSERLRQEVLRRPSYTNDDIARFCDCARQNDISIRVFVIVGLPGETKEDWRRTVECLRRCRPAHLISSIFYPYRGTDLYEQCKSQGLLLEDGDHHIALRERRTPGIDQPQFPAWRVKREYLLLEWRAYHGILPTPQVLIRTARTFLGAWGWTDRLYRHLVDGAGFLTSHRRKYWGW